MGALHHYFRSLVSVVKRKITLVFWRIQHEKRIMLVYMDDFLITRDDMKGVDSLKKYLQKHFQIKDLGSLFTS